MHHVVSVTGMKMRIDFLVQQPICSFPLYLLPFNNIIYVISAIMPVFRVSNITRTHRVLVMASGLEEFLEKGKLYILP